MISMSARRFLLVTRSPKKPFPASNVRAEIAERGQAPARREDLLCLASSVVIPYVEKTEFIQRMRQCLKAQ